MTAVAVPARRAASGLRALWRALAREKLTVVLLVLLLAIVVLAVFAEQVAPYDPIEQSLLSVNQAPSPDHWLGTDQFGRDVLSRIIYGARTSLVLGLLAPGIAAAIGMLLGVAGGYWGGWPDRVLGRVVDLLLAFPALLLGILVAAALSAGFWSMVTVLVIAFAPRFARIARASTLSLRQEPFIEAAVAAGVGPVTIIARHVLPNISGPVVVLGTLEIAAAIRLEATLSFLGLGTQAPEPSWGNIIRDGLNNLFGSPWPIIAAGVAITVTVLAFNMLGDAVRDVLDPESRT